MSKDDRKSHEVFDEKQFEIIEQCIANLPQIVTTAEVSTEGSGDIVVLDIVTIIAKLERTNIPDGKTASPVCSRTYPFTKTDKFYVFVTDITGTNIFSLVKFDGNEKLQTREFKFQAPPHMAGEVALKTICFSDSYIGLEYESEVRFTVKKEADESRQMYTYHEDDIKREPTLFEQAMQGLHGENSDDDEEEDENSKKQGRLKFYFHNF